LMQLREEGTLLLNYRELTEIIGYLCRAWFNRRFYLIPCT
jgi:hypothetical protein